MRLALSTWVWIYLGYLEADKIKGAVLDAEVNPFLLVPSWWIQNDWDTELLVAKNWIKFLLVILFLLKVLHTLKTLCNVPIYQHMSKCVKYCLSFPETHEFDYLHVIWGFLFPEVDSVSSKSLPTKHLGWRDPADQFCPQASVNPCCPRVIKRPSFT